MTKDNQNTEIKPLNKVFIGRGEVRGFKFSQIRVAESAFLYEVDNDGAKHYEVFRKVINHRFACVSYPKSRSFGKWAWSYMDINSAFKKFNQLNPCD